MFRYVSKLDRMSSNSPIPNAQEVRSVILSHIADVMVKPFVLKEVGVVGLNSLYVSKS